MFYFMVEEKEDRFTLFKQGDERIFRQYYEKYYHALCLWVVRIIKEETRMHDDRSGGFYCFVEQPDDYRI